MTDMTDMPGTRINKQGAETGRFQSRVANICMRESMTRSEAYVAMENGNKIAHYYFASDEYLFINLEDGLIHDEKGYYFEEGWRIRDGGVWLTGWSIYI